MSTLGINSSTMQLRLPVGAPYNLRLRMRDGDAGYQDLTGRVFALTFFTGAASPFSIAGTIGQDDVGSYISFAVDGATSTDLRGKLGLGWEVAELFTDGKAPLLSGQLFVSAAAFEADGTATRESSEFDDVEWSPASQVLVVTPTGARGLSAAEQLYPEIIDAPTEQAFQELILSLQAQIADLKIGPRLDFSDPNYSGFLVALGLVTVEAS